MKIIVISNFLGPFGGAENFINRLSEKLKQRSFEVFFYSTNKKPYFIEDYQYSNYFPDYVDYSNLTRFQKIKNFIRPIYNIEAAKNLDNYLKEIKPDLAILDNIYFHLTSSVINTCKNNKIPMAMVLHDPRLFCPAGTLMKKNKYYCESEDCIKGNSLNCLFNKCKHGKLDSSLIAVIEHYFCKISKPYKNIEQFICPSQAILNLAKRSGISDNKLIKLNHFIEDKILQKTPALTDKNYFIFAGRLAKEKGVHYLLEAKKELPDVKLKIIGDGPEEDNLRELSEKLNIKNVEFLGYKTKSELDEYYKNCIATILPCDWFENFPNAILESFAYSKPVIGSNVGGIPDMIGKNNECGIITQRANVHELKEAIDFLYKNKQLALKMGQNGRNKAEKLYNSDVYMTNMITLLKEIKHNYVK